MKRGSYPILITTCWFCLLGILLPGTARASERDSLKNLANIPGADMSLYHLYTELAPKRYAEAMNYAALFVKALDTTYADPIAARMCNAVADFHEKEEFVYSDAIEWRMRSLHMYSLLGDDFGAGYTLYNLSRIYYRRSEFHLTLQTLDKALDLLTPYEPAPIVAECYNLLGATYFMCQDYPNAQRHFTRYAQEVMARRDSIKIPVALNNLAVYAQSQGDTTRCRQLIETSISICKEKNNQEMLAHSYINLINNLIESGNIAKAESYLEMTRPLVHNAEMRGKCHTNASQIHQIKEDWEASIACLWSAIEEYKKGEFEMDLRSCYSDLIELYKIVGDDEKVNEVALELYNISKHRKLETTYQQLFQYQNEIIQQTEIERKLEKENNHRVLMVVSIGGILLFIMGVILYFWKRREIVRRNEIELQKERLINEKNQQAIRSKNEILEIRRMEEFKVDSMRADVIEQLNSLKPLIKEKEVRDRINQICNEIEKSKEGDLWEEISQYIPEFNSEFFQRLTQDFPTLSVNERRLCAFLNLNLSTKEISEITRQSPHSINIARGRLRKKLGLTGSELSIQEFLTKYNQQTTEQ